MSHTATKLLLPVLLFATTAFAQPSASAEVKVGTAVEKYEVTGASDSFKVAPDTRIYAGTKVKGMEAQKVTVVFLREGTEASKVELNVPRSPYRTHAYKTMRAGDSGAWTVKVLGPDGAELASKSFQVEVAAP
jgi:nitrogen fixation protein FixH